LTLQPFLRASAMKPCTVVCALALLVAADAGTPVQKVVGLLEEMSSKGKAEKEAEQVVFASFKTWCEEIKVQKEADLESMHLASETLSATIEQNMNVVRDNAATIQKAETDKDLWQRDILAATKVRDIERRDYDVTHKDYTESIDALERAIPVIKSQDFDRKQSHVSLLQLSVLQKSALVPDGVKSALTAFLQAQEPSATYEAPQANAYEFHADHIVEMLEGLLKKFTEQTNKLATDEGDAQHSFDILLQELTHDITQADQSIDALTKASTQLSEDTVLKKTELADTQTTLASDTAFLKDTVSMCVNKAGEYEDRQRLRTEELGAIEKAIEILSGSSVSGVAKKYLSTDEPVKATALLQMFSSVRHVTPTLRAEEYLKHQGKRLGSHVLSTIALKIKSSPFDKVIQMIKELVDKLVVQINDETTQKGWCDTELAKNEHSRTTHGTDVSNLKSRIDTLDASIAKLAQETADLTKSLSELQAAMDEASHQRKKDSDINAQTVSDANEAKTAVVEAMTVLKEFYAQAGEATALAQQQPTPPPTWDTAYTGMQDRNGGVLGMLQVILSDFVKLAARTEAQEEADTREFDAFTEASRVEIAQREQDLKHRQSSTQKQTTEKEEAEQDLRTMTLQLDSDLDYFEKLKPTCVHTDMSHEDKMRRRAEEIDSLKEALRILNGEEATA